MKTLSKNSLADINIGLMKDEFVLPNKIMPNIVNFEFNVDIK